MTRSTLALVLLVVAGCTDRPLVPIGRLSGSVEVAPGVPASGATVSVPAYHRGTLADDAGNFTLDGLPLGPLTVVVSAPSTLETVKIVDYTLESGAPPLAIALTGMGFIDGAVASVGADAAPIPHAQVAIGAAPGSAITDDAGHFSLRVPIGDYTLIGSAAGFLPATATALAVTWNHTTPVSLVLTRGQATSRFEGTIVRVGQVDHSGTLVQLPGTAFSAFTDGTGHFSIADVPDGLYSITYGYGGFSDRVDNVLLGAGRPYLLEKQLTPLGTLELLPATRLCGEGRYTSALSTTAQIVTGPSHLAIVGIDGHERYADDNAGGQYVAPLSTTFSASPLGTHVFYQRHRLADGTATSRIVRASDGQTVDVPGWGQTIGWLGETDVVFALPHLGDATMTHDLFRASIAGGATSLGSVHAGSLGDLAGEAFYVIDGPRLELRRKSDGTLILSEPSVSARCWDGRCLYEKGGTYRVAYGDGQVFDTGVSVAGLATMPTPSGCALIGPERVFWYETRSGIDLPEASSWLTSWGCHWIYKQNPFALYALANDGLVLRAAAVGAPSVLAAPTDDAVVVEGKLLLLDGSAGDQTIDCPGCSYLAASPLGVLATADLASGTSYQALSRFDATTHQTLALAVPPLRNIVTSYGDSIVGRAVDQTAWLARAATGTGVALGRDVWVQRWLDPKHIVIRRDAVPSGDFAMELP